MQADKPISGFRPQLVISKALIVKELPDSRCCVFAATTAQQSTESQIVSHHQENRFYRIASGEERLDNDERELGSDGILGRWWGGDLAGGAVIGGRDGVERPVGRERQAESVAAIMLIIRVLLIPPAPPLRQEVQGKY